MANGRMSTMQSLILLESMEGKRVPADKLALTRVSKFFSSLFEHVSNPELVPWDLEEDHFVDRSHNERRPTLKGQTTTTTRVVLPLYKLPTVPFDSLKTVVSLVENTSIEIRGNDSHHLQEILEAAEFLFMPAVSNPIQDVLGQHLTESVACGAYCYAENRSLPLLKKHALDRILGNFGEATNGSEFVRLPVERVEEILTCDRLACGEDTAWRAAVNWSRYSNKPEDAKKALSSVRLGLLDKNFFGEEVKEIMATVDTSVIKEVEKFYDARDNKELLTVYQSMPKFGRPRAPSSYVLTFGGFAAGDSTAEIFAFDLSTNVWRLLPSVTLPSQLVYATTTVVGNFLYLVGGTEAACNKYTWRIDLNNLEDGFKRLNIMSTGRNFVSSAALGNKVYAIGGRSDNGDQQQRHNSSEEFDIETMMWKYLPPMIKRRSDACAVACDGKIYVVGGFDGQNQLSCAEVYCPQKNTWALLPEMSTRRSGVKCVERNGRIYVVGGNDGNDRLSSCECYNPKSRTWRRLPDLNVRRSNHALVVVEDKVVAIGGYEGNGTTQSTEILDEKQKKWLPLADLPMPMSGMAASVVPSVSSLSQATEDVLRIKDEDLLQLMAGDTVDIEQPMEIDDEWTE